MIGVTKLSTIKLTRPLTPLTVTVDLHDLSPRTRAETEKLQKDHLDCTQAKIKTLDIDLNIKGNR